MGQLVSDWERKRKDERKLRGGERTEDFQWVCSDAFVEQGVPWSTP